MTLYYIVCCLIAVGFIIESNDEDYEGGWMPIVIFILLSFVLVPIMIGAYLESIHKKKKEK